MSELEKNVLNEEAVADVDQAVRNVGKGDLALGFVVFSEIFQIFVKRVNESYLDCAVGRAAVLEEARVMIVFKRVDGV